MPAKKPKSKHRVPLIVTCSTAHKQQIDEILSHYPVRFRSKCLMDFLKEAIAESKTDIADESYWHGTNTQFQVSCSPQDKQLIDEFCKKYLPPKKRSRWIVQRILDLDKENAEVQTGRHHSSKPRHFYYNQGTKFRGVFINLIDESHH